MGHARAALARSNSESPRANRTVPRYARVMADEVLDIAHQRNPLCTKIPLGSLAMHACIFFPVAVIRSALRKEMLSEEELEGQPRDQGVEGPAVVKLARLEGDGRMSVLKK